VNERVYDGPDLSRSPYRTGQFFSVALPMPATASTMSVYVGPEFWLGNTLAPSQVRIDFGDGLGERLVVMGTTVEVTVNPGGFNRGNLTTLPIGAPAGQVISVNLSAKPSGLGLRAATTLSSLTLASIPPDVALGLLASRKWPGFRPDRGVRGPNGEATAIAWIKYAASNAGSKKLRRPLVFVEGIDFATTRSRSYGFPFFPINHSVAATGPLPLADFERVAYDRTQLGFPYLGGYRNGSAGWNEVVDYNSEFPEVEKFPALREQLQAPPSQTFPGGVTGGDYDIIYLDFSDGATLIQHNAMVLVELLEWINKPENRAPNAEETMVIGASMGGQVSRFALAWMEQQGLCHNAKLWVSLDSPHRGANISLGIQHMFNRLKNVAAGSDAALNIVNNSLLREASKQMVIWHFSPDATPLRNQWQAWQNGSESYPSLLRKVAIANGSGQAQFQVGMTPGMRLLRTNGVGINTGLNYAYALPGTSTKGENNVVFRWLRPFALTDNWHYSYCDPGASYADQAPGSFRNTSLDAYKQSDGRLKYDHPSQTFVSTLSALDV